MFDWPTGAAREIRSELVELYWFFLGFVVVISILLELFSVSDRKIGPNGILKRVIISMILLWSFEDVINTIGMVTDGIVEKVGGNANLESLLANIKNSYEAQMPGMFKFQQMLLYILGLGCYMISLLGYYLTEVSINFVYTILYILSPLLILAYVSESTAYITKNMYKGLFQVALWKITWCVLGSLLLKLTAIPQAADWDDFFMQSLLNLFIGISMLMIPLFTKGLLADGLASVASGIAGASTMPLSMFMSKLPLNTLKGGAKEVFSGFGGSRKFTGRKITGFKRRVKKAKKKWAKSRKEAIEKRNKNRSRKDNNANTTEKKGANIEKQNSK